MWFEIGCIYKKGNVIQAASQPTLFELVFKLERSVNYNKYINSEHFKTNREYWLPTGITLYEGVDHLVPNHYFDSVQNKQIRYWPSKARQEMYLDDAVEKLALLLKNSVLAANKRFKLALGLTCGIDSRMLLSACKDIIDDVFVYTLKYRRLNEHSNDIRIPEKLSASVGFDYHLLDCRINLDNQFLDIYANNCDAPHTNDWGIIANGLYKNYPLERVNLKGTCAEIARCVYYRSGKHLKIRTSNCFLPQGWGKIDFIKKRVSGWFREMLINNCYCGYDLYDLFYMEHRMGGWQSQSQLEDDIAVETFTPFNNREIIDVMLAVHPKYRIAPDNIFFTKTIQNLWDQLLELPVSPIKNIERIKKKIKNTLVYYRIIKIKF